MARNPTQEEYGRMRHNGCVADGIFSETDYLLSGCAKDLRDNMVAGIEIPEEIRMALCKHVESYRASVLRLLDQQLARFDSGVKIAAWAE